MTIPAPLLLKKEQVAVIIGSSPDSVACAVKRHRTDLAPTPIKIGRRNYWTPESVQAWVAAQAAAQGQAAVQASAQAQDTASKSSQASSAAPMASTPPRRGRPTKAEARAKIAVSAAKAAAKAALNPTKEGE